jgi:hypothetical protein
MGRPKTLWACKGCYILPFVFMQNYAKMYAATTKQPWKQKQKHKKEE